MTITRRAALEVACLEVEVACWPDTHSPRSNTQGSTQRSPTGRSDFRRHAHQ